MYCSKCGKELGDESLFCAFCGSRTQRKNTDGYPQQNECDRMANERANTESKATMLVSNSEKKYVPYRKATSGQSKRGMKWYYFLIYFALIVGPIIDIYSGMLLLGEEKILYASVIIAVAVYGLFVRSQLAGYKFNAPARLTAYYLLSSGLSFVVSIEDSIELEQSYGWIMEMAGEDLTGYIVLALGVMVASTLVMVHCNHVYFEKRHELFLN